MSPEKDRPVLDDEPIFLRPKFRGRIVNTLLKLKYYTKTITQEICLIRFYSR